MKKRKKIQKKKRKKSVGRGKEGSNALRKLENEVLKVNKRE